MDENRQDKTESVLPATENKLWLPPLSPKDQERLDRLQRDGLMKATYKRTGLPGKTLWDCLQLFFQAVGAVAIPLSVIVGVYQFNAQQQSNNQAAAEQYKQTQQFTQDQQRETSLETYLNRISDLLTVDHLLESHPGATVRTLAEARTLIEIQNLDPRRIRILIKFLWKAQLINGPQPIIDLSTAYLKNADLSYLVLDHINLSRALLDGANFLYTSLKGSDLSRSILTRADLRAAALDVANLKDAKLQGADLSCAELPSVQGAYLECTDLPRVNLSGANLSGANLSGANLSGVDLEGAKLLEAKLSGANLSGAHLAYVDLSRIDLSGADLTFADLRGTDLSGADLTFADLSYAIDVTQEQLAQAKSLKGAIMPDGSTHP